MPEHQPESHVEFLTRFCGKHCNHDTDWHCITCHRNAELTTLAECHDVLIEFKKMLEMLGPMAGMMGGGLPVGFGRG